MAFFAIPFIPPIAKAIAICLGAAGAAVAGWLGFREAAAEEISVQPEQSQKPAEDPAPSLITRVCEEVKQVVTDGVEVACEVVTETIEKIEEKVEQAQEFIADATERISEGVRLVSRALTSLVMGLDLPWSGMMAHIRDVQMLRKSFLKSPPLIRAPSQPLFTA